MYQKLFAHAGVALSVCGVAIAIAPVAGAYANCSEAIAAGAAPIYAGQPGYSKKLDRDGDGVACETGGSSASSATGAYAPSPYVQTPYVPSAPALVAPTAPVSPYAATGVMTVVQWAGANCIDITAPDASAAGVLRTGNYCGGSASFAITPQSADQMVGADPAIGAASSASCEIIDKRLIDSGVAGDGHDINCLTRASYVS